MINFSKAFKFLRLQLNFENTRKLKGMELKLNDTEYLLVWSSLRRTSNSH